MRDRQHVCRVLTKNAKVKHNHQKKIRKGLSTKSIVSTFQKCQGYDRQTDRQTLELSQKEGDWAGVTTKCKCHSRGDPGAKGGHQWTTNYNGNKVYTL